jgi:hypothetical protein
MSLRTLGTVALVLGSVALVTALTAAVLAVLVMRQNARTTTDLRRHRHAHHRTHGRPDPDPEHHGTSPTVDRLAHDLDELRQFVIALARWADGITAHLGLDDHHDDDPDATAHMPATDRPTPNGHAPRHRRQETTP